MEEKKTVFVVDDSVANLSVAEKALEREFRILTMSSADRMFTILDRVTPDMILMDVAMPEMSGFDAIKLLKSNKAFAEIPVIFLTALADSYNEAYGIELGAADFITKPFHETVLLHRIRHHLNIENMLKGRTQQLEQALMASKAKSSFLSIMSQEICAPMNAIIGMASIGKASNDIAQKDDSLKKIEEASRHLLEVMDEILDISKIESVFREDVENCLEAGMSDHVGKPPDTAELIAKLRRFSC